MMLPSEERTELFIRRNEILRKFNELLENREYKEASVILKEAIEISEKLGETYRVDEYSKKIEQCLAKVREIERDSKLIKSEPDLQVDNIKERDKLITYAQEAFQKEQFEDACNYYRKAVEVCRRLNDQKTIWKLTKYISLLEEKMASTAKNVDSTIPLRKSLEKSQNAIRQEKPKIQLSVIPEQPVKKEIPFFKSVVEDKKLEEPKKKEIKKDKSKEKKKKEKEINKKRKSQIGKSALASDVLAEIRSFKSEKLESTPPEMHEKKSVVKPSPFPADIIEELRKKAADKKLKTD